ncbi:MAG TPA: heavy metal-binding domain-containing protein [Nitrospiria bacterium]|nr:heavy metal-binding domain-containing protein [Nitrospiria bacterium]
MICPLCGYNQPDFAHECLQCHTPISHPSADAIVNQEQEEDQEENQEERTDTIVRVERRRKARAHGDRPVNKEPVPVRHRHEADSSDPSESSRPAQRPPQSPPRPVKPLPAAPSVASKPHAATQAKVRIPEVSSHSSDGRSSSEPLPPPVKAVHSQSGGSPSIPDRTPSESGEHLNHLVDKLKRVTVTTTPEVQGRPVKEYKGIVSTGSVVKLEGWASYLGGLKDIGSLRHAPFDAQIRKARDVLITELKIEAAKLGANGVVGMTVQLHPVQQGAADRLLWLVAIGTAVVLPE